MGVSSALTRSRDFAIVHQRGRRARSDGVAVIALRRADEGPPRLGLSVSKRFGNAVVRNRIRRRLRAAATSHMPEGFDVVIRAAGPGLERVAFQELENHVLTAIRRAAA